MENGYVQGQKMEEKYYIILFKQKIFLCISLSFWLFSFDLVLILHLFNVDVIYLKNLFNSSDYCFTNKITLLQLLIELVHFKHGNFLFYSLNKIIYQSIKIKYEAKQKFHK